MLIIPIFIPHLGCPHDCCFCNQRSISGQISLPTREEILSTINSYRLIAANYDRTELAFFGGTFTAIPMEDQKNFLETVFPYVKKSGNSEAFIDGIRLSTRPDAISEEILCQLKRYGVETIELGAQSMDDSVLFLSKRGHRAADTVKSSEMIKNAGFTLGLQTMPGLPGSNREKDLETAASVIALKPAIVRIYPTIVIKRTYLEVMMGEGRYTPLDLEDAVDLCGELVPMYEQAGIKVIRLGLHSTENMCTDRDIAAGPYHPAFGELVYSKIALNETVKKIDEQIRKSGKKEELEILVPPGKISVFVGNKRKNILFLQEKYGFSSVKVLENIPKNREIPGNRLAVLF